MGLFGLFGGYGEFDDWAADVHRKLVQAGTGDGSVRILPMALDEEIVRSEDLPLYERLRIPVEVVSVASRDDAERVECAEALSSASLIFLHGGMPEWVCDVLRDTPVWLATQAALKRGASLAGTSGGIVCQGRQVPTFNEETREVGWVPGFGVLPSALIAAHWNNPKYEWIAKPFRARKDSVVVAVSEKTALLGDGVRWIVSGEGSVHVLRTDTDERYPAGDNFELDILTTTVDE